MEEQSGLSEQYRTASPWPVFVALGLVLSETGVFLGLLPVGIAGVLLLEGSVVGILRESGYTESLWTTSLLVGAFFTAAGVGFYVLSYVTRAATLLGAGAVALLAGIALFLYETGYL